MIEINKNYNENNLDTMSRMPDNFIDLTVTSPPYDKLRKYNGYSFDFESIAKELFRVTKKRGVVVWIVGDSTIKGSESGTTAKMCILNNRNWIGSEMSRGYCDIIDERVNEALEDIKKRR